MQSINIKKIKFSSFVKLTALTSLSIGIIFGILMMINAFLGGNVKTNIGTTQLIGFAGGIASLFVGPLVFLLVGLFASIIGYFPFKLMLLVMKKISVYGEFENMTTCLVDPMEVFQHEKSKPMTCEKQVD